MTEIRTVKPVTGDEILGETLQAGEWCLWRGHYYIVLGCGLLAGPVGSREVYLPAGEIVRRVRLYDESSYQLS